MLLGRALTTTIIVIMLQYFTVKNVTTIKLDSAYFGDYDVAELGTRNANTHKVICFFYSNCYHPTIHVVAVEIQPKE